MPLNQTEVALGSCKLSYETSESRYVEKSLSIDEPHDNLDDWRQDLSLDHKELHSSLQEYIGTVREQFRTAQWQQWQQWLQTSVVPFQDYFSTNVTPYCQKVGEGLYSEVFMFRNPQGNPTVVKVIPTEGEVMVNGEHQKSLKDVLCEIIIAKKLSGLRYNDVNQTSNFIEVKSIHCVQGLYPEELVDAWNLYKENKGSINDSPEIFNKEQYYVILETNYGGCDMAAFQFDNAAQIFSAILQVAFALAVAEEELQFEHRDLHWGNILLQRVPVYEKVLFKLKGQEMKVRSFGVKATIIDFTMSRCTVDDINFSINLSEDCGIFRGSGDYQFEIYRLMQKKNGNEWSHFEPYSNVLWLSYFLDKAITTMQYSDNCSKLHKKYMNKLKELHLEVLGFDSARELVFHLFGDKLL